MKKSHFSVQKYIRLVNSFYITNEQALERFKETENQSRKVFICVEMLPALSSMKHELRSFIKAAGRK